jgi:hypothetical protein
MRPSYSAFTHRYMIRSGYPSLLGIAAQRWALLVRTPTFNSLDLPEWPGTISVTSIERSHPCSGLSSPPTWIRTGARSCDSVTPDALRLPRHGVTVLIMSFPHVG